MKYALVTGGSRGIGRAICVKLHQMGYEVLINYVSNDAAAKETLDLIEGHGELLRFDVSDPVAVQEAISGRTTSSSGWNPPNGQKSLTPTSIPGTM